MDMLLVQFPDLFLRLFGLPINGLRIVQEDAVLGSQIVQQRGPFRIEQGDVLLHPFENLILHVLPDLSGKLGSLRKLRPRACVQDHLPTGRNADFPKLLQRPLRGTVESPDGLHLIAKKLDPAWMLRGGRKDVQDTAPDAELSHLLHHRHALIPGRDQPLQQGLAIQFIPDLDLRRGLQQHVGRDREIQQRARGGDHNARIVEQQPLQGLDPQSDHIGGGRSLLVRQRLPFREKADLLRIHDRGQIVPKLLRGLVIRRRNQSRKTDLPIGRRDPEGFECPGQAVQLQGARAFAEPAPAFLETCRRGDVSAQGFDHDGVRGMVISEW